MLRPLPFHEPERIVEFAGRRQNARANISFSHEAFGKPIPAATARGYRALMPRQVEQERVQSEQKVS